MAKPTKKLFNPVEPGNHIARISIDEGDPVQKEGQPAREGRVYTVTFKIEGGSSDGGSIRDFFSTRTKNDFGVSRLAGLMIAARVYSKDPTADVDVAWFEGQAAEGAIRSKLDGKMVGIVVTQRKGQEFPNVVEFMSIKEAQSKSKGNGSSEHAVTSEPAKESKPKQEMIWE